MYKNFLNLQMVDDSTEDLFNQSSTVQGGAVSVQQIIQMYSRGEAPQGFKALDEGSQLRMPLIPHTYEEALQLSQEYYSKWMQEMSERQNTPAESSSESPAEPPAEPPAGVPAEN